MVSKEMRFSKHDINDKDFSKRRKHMSSIEPELLFKKEQVSEDVLGAWQGRELSIK